MKTRFLSPLILSALILLAVTVAGSDARAEVRVGLTVRTPGLLVSVGDAGLVVAGRHRPVRVPRAVPIVHVDREDRRVARRLADYTGVDERELLRLRRHGWSWREIGRELGLSGRVVRAAATERSWRAFLDGRKPAGWCGTRIR